MVALESLALGLAKTIVQKAAAAWIADRRTAEESKKELSALLTPRFRRAAPEQRFLDMAAAELASFSHEFRGLDDGDREAALLAVRDAFERADLTDRALFGVDLDAAKLARRLRAGQPRAKTAAGLGEAGGAFYDAALDRCCQLYVRAVVQVPTFVGRSSAEILNRLSGLPDQVAARVVAILREAQAAVASPEGGVTAAGRPLEEATDPFDLEVHRPVRPEDAPPGLPLLPPYVPREHDEVLSQVVRAAAGGRSGIAVLVGGSSTGKTRACWEALALLRGQDPPWRLWHPIDPSRPDAALRELPGIGPRTVVWLNEAQEYLDADAGLGEKIAAGLRELLRDPARGPVIVLATQWPEYWHSLTARPACGKDRHAQARELLAGHDIPVPAAFTPAQVGQLARAADVRMALAARSARDGEVIQFLAGAPELLARYRNAPPGARALIEAAMDARRLGIGAGLPQAFLEAAAPGYLTDDQWDGLGEDWLERALAYTAVPCKGARGPLTRIRPRPASRAARDRGDQPGSMAAAAGSLYRLADYLDQHGRANRASQIPPAEFWSAAAHAAPDDQAELGDAADARGLYRDATQLHKNAAASGNTRAAFYLTHPAACLRADPRPAHWAAAHVTLDDPRDVAMLLASLSWAGAADQAAALLDREPAAHVTLDDPDDVAYLLISLMQAGAADQAAALASRAALDNPARVAKLLDSLRRAGVADQAAALLAREPAAHVTLDDPDDVARLLDSLREAGAADQAASLADRAAAHVTLDHPARVARLLDSLLKAGAADQAGALLARDPAAHVALDHPARVAYLLGSLLKAGAADQAGALLARDPAAHVTLDDPDDVAFLLDRLREAGAADQAASLADRAAAHVTLDHPARVARLLGTLLQAGAADQAGALLARDPAAHVALDDPADVAYLLGSLLQAGAADQAGALLARDPAAHVTLDHPDDVAFLLDRLREAGAADQAASLADRAALDHPARVARLLDSLSEVGVADQAAALASRAAAHAPLDHPAGVASLLASLRWVGVGDQAAALLARDPAAHVALDDPAGVAFLLGTLLQAGAADQAGALLARDPAAHVALDDPADVAYLLGSLLQAGAADQAGALLARDPAAHVTLDHPDDVAFLLDRLREAGAADQAAALAGRLPAVGMFGLFLKRNGSTGQLRFGLEADGTSAAPWSWEDLHL